VALQPHGVDEDIEGDGEGKKRGSRDICREAHNHDGKGAESASKGQRVCA